MKAISRRNTMQEIATDHAIHPIEVCQAKRQLIGDACEYSLQTTKYGQWRKPVQGDQTIQHIGKLLKELEPLNKSFSCSDPRELYKLVD